MPLGVLGGAGAQGRRCKLLLNLHELQYPKSAPMYALLAVVIGEMADSKTVMKTIPGPARPCHVILVQLVICTDYNTDNVNHYNQLIHLIRIQFFSTSKLFLKSSKKSG